MMMDVVIESSDGDFHICPLVNENCAGSVKGTLMIEDEVIEALNQVVICTVLERRTFGCHVLIMSIGSKVS